VISKGRGRRGRAGSRTLPGVAQRVAYGDKSAGAATALFAMAGSLAAASGAPGWAVATLLAVGVAVALSGVVLRWRNQRDGPRRQLSREMRVAPARVASAVKAEGSYVLGVDTEAPAALDALQLAQGSHPAYLPRLIDEELRKRLHDAGQHDDVSLIVVSGRSKAGKSRTLIHNLSQALSDAWLLTPKTSRALARLARDGPPSGVGQRVLVVWLDDIELYADVTSGLNRESLRQFAEWHRPVVIVGTHGGKGIELAGKDVGRFREITSDLFASYPAVMLDSTLGSEEVASASVLWSGAVAKRIESEGIGEFMIAAPRIVERLLGPDSPEGKAIVWAAVDCQRAGLVRGCSIVQLKELFGAYVSGPATQERFERGLEWAASPLYARVALLHRNGESDRYYPHDYLGEYARRQAMHIKPTVWDKLNFDSSLDPEDLVRLGAAALKVNDVEHAIEAWRRADDLGSGLGAFNLGWLLESRNDRASAEDAYSRAGIRGFSHATGCLGRLLDMRGDVEGAAAALRAADEVGDAQGACWHGWFLESRREDLTGAEAAYGRAEDRGHSHGATGIGRVLERRGDILGAEAAYRRADDRGDGAGACGLGRLLERRDDLDGAVAAYRRADKRGDGRGSRWLGWILEHRLEDLTGAESAYRRADERGDSWASGQLGWVLQRRGDLAGAEAAYRRGDRRGNGTASGRLGLLLWNCGKACEGIVALRRGVERGNGSAAINLGAVLWCEGDLEGAEDAYRLAETLGEPSAPLVLGEMAERRGDSAGAEDAYGRAEVRARHKNDDDMGGAAYVLGRLMLRKGDAGSAEEAFERSDKQGDLRGTLWLAWTLANERKRPAAALAVYRRADMRGDPHGANCAGILLRARGKQGEALLAFLRADERHSAEGALHLGEMLIAGAPRSRDHRRALAAFVRARERAERVHDEALADRAARSFADAIDDNGSGADVSS
jgi:tetratricopeptide (TPR) repeat protein